MRGGRVQIHYKQAIIGPPLNGVSLSCRWCANIECWLGSFVIFRDPDQYCLEILYICDLQGGGGGSGSLSPLAPLHPRMDSAH